MHILSSVYLCVKYGLCSLTLSVGEMLSVGNRLTCGECSCSCCVKQPKLQKLGKLWLLTYRHPFVMIPPFYFPCFNLYMFLDNLRVQFKVHWTKSCKRLITLYAQHSHPHARAHTLYLNTHRAHPLALSQHVILMIRCGMPHYRHTQLCSYSTIDGPGAFFTSLYPPGVMLRHKVLAHQTASSNHTHLHEIK